MDFDAYLEALASDAPAPGGGSAATLVGALAAALCAMVARLTLAAPKRAAQHAAAATIVAAADGLRARFVALRPIDEAAFRAVVDAQGLPRVTDADAAVRRDHLQRALAGAAAAPLEGARLSAEAFAVAARTAELRNANLMSDVACALQFARAAFDASVVNVEVNHRYITDAALIAQQAETLTALARAARDDEARAGAIVAEGRDR